MHASSKRPKVEIQEQAKEAKEQKGGFSLNIGLPGVPKLSQGAAASVNGISTWSVLARKANGQRTAVVAKSMSKPLFLMLRTS